MSDNNDLSRRALTDLRRTKLQPGDDQYLSPASWVDVYGRVLAEDLAVQNGLMAAAAAHIKSMFSVLEIGISGVQVLSAKVNTFRIATLSTPNRPKISARSWQRASDPLVATCESLVTNFLGAAIRAFPVTKESADPDPAVAEAVVDGFTEVLEELKKVPENVDTSVFEGAIQRFRRARDRRLSACTSAPKDGAETITPTTETESRG